MVEPCVYIPSREALPDKHRVVKFSRIYFGSEFCERKLPADEELDRVFQLGRPVSVVTPMVGPAGLRRVRGLSDHLERTGRTCEIVVNDFGVLETIRGRAGLTPVLGRLLTRNVFDLNQGRLIVPSEDLFELLGGKYGIDRYEMTNYRSRLKPPESSLPPEVRLSLYHPYMYLATTRQCLFRFRPEDNLHSGPDPVDELSCDVPCKDHFFKFQYPGIIKEDIFLKGNTLFTCFEDIGYPKSELHRLCVDRIVFSTNLPV